jgi:hypothetical protein
MCNLLSHIGRCSTVGSARTLASQSRRSLIVYIGGDYGKGRNDHSGRSQ